MAEVDRHERRNISWWVRRMRTKSINRPPTQQTLFQTVFTNIPFHASKRPKPVSTKTTLRLYAVGQIPTGAIRDVLFVPPQHGGMCVCGRRPWFVAEKRRTARDTYAPNALSRLPFTLRQLMAFAKRRLLEDRTRMNIRLWSTAIAWQPQPSYRQSFYVYIVALFMNIHRGGKKTCHRVQCVQIARWRLRPPLYASLRWFTRTTQGSSLARRRYFRARQQHHSCTSVYRKQLSII